MGTKGLKKKKVHAESRVEDSGLTIIQERVAVALAAGMRMSDISRDTGVAVSTIATWRKQAAFAAHYKRLIAETAREIRGGLAEMKDLALSTMKEILEGGGEQARVKVACYICDYPVMEQREAKKLKLRNAAKNGNK